jgi:urea transport system permease protein
MKPQLRTCIGMVALLLAFGSSRAQPPEAPARADAALAPLITALPAADFSEKRTLIKQLADLHDPRVRPVLQALLKGNLSARTADNHVFIAAVEEPDTGNVRLIDPMSGAAAGSAPAGDFTAIGVNNQLRKTLRVSLAQFDLASADPRVRLSAVTEMLRALDPDSIAVLRDRQNHEPDPSVKREIQVGLALTDLDSNDADTRLAAVKQISGSLNPDVFNRLSALMQAAADGSPAEADPRVRSAARAALLAIEHSRRFYSAIQTLLYGLSQGSVLVLAAVGLAITFGVMGVINMAHGELMMLGAYTTYVVQLLMPHYIGASIIVALPAAFLVSGLVGVAIERCIVRHLYGRPLETLLATFGVSLILQQAVRDIFSANNRPVETPNWLAGSLATQRSAGNYLQSSLHHRVHLGAIFAVVGCAETHAAGPGGAGGFPESSDGEGHGRAHRMGGRIDVRPRFGDCRGRWGRAESAHQCGSKPGTELHR